MTEALIQRMPMDEEIRHGDGSNDYVSYYGLLTPFMHKFNWQWRVDKMLIEGPCLIDLRVGNEWCRTLMYTNEDFEWVFSDQRFNIWGFAGREVRIPNPKKQAVSRIGDGSC